MFTSLHHLIDIDWMSEAYRRTRKDGATGIDGVTADDYEKDLEANLESLLDRIKSGSYRAPPVRRHYIPKADGTKRPLGIPTFEDKVAQRAILMLLEPIYETGFLPCSYGFRRGRSAHDALSALRKGIIEQRQRWVIDADISKYFDSITHSHLRSFLDLRIKDGVARRMIDKWLKAGVLEEDALHRPVAGTPQGGVISPMLSNVYLHHVLDEWFEKACIPLTYGWRSAKPVSSTTEAWLRYHYLRLSLLPKERPPILEAANAVPPARSRQQYLRGIFNERIDFEHWKRMLVYVPVGVEDGPEGPLMLGRIGRSIASTENAPPESGFEEITRPSWRAANVIIDTSDHPDGQKVAFQLHPNVGRPLPIAARLVDHLNEVNPDSGWLIEINLIKNQQTFWDAANRHRGEITLAEFTFVTPNILGIRSQLNKELKGKRERHNATSVTEALHNPKDNLDLDDAQVKDAVDYISEGGGKTKLKVGRETVYDSENEGRLVEVEDDEPLTRGNPSTWKRISSKLFR